MIFSLFVFTFESKNVILILDDNMCVKIGFSFLMCERKRAKNELHSICKCQKRNEK